jgi:cytidylate kinase
MSSDAHLLAKQLKRHDINQQLLSLTARSETEHTSDKPVITISRELGSGGLTMGRLAATELGLKYYDREIIERIAQQTRSSEKHIHQHENEPRDPISKMLLNLLDPRHVSDTVYLRHLIKVLNEVSSEGKVLIIGSGGSCVLRQSLKIRVIAPFDLRVARVMDLENLTHEQAYQQVLQSDHARKRFLRNYFTCQADFPLAFDLVLNTEIMSVEHGAELIIQRYRQMWGDAA